MPNQYGEEVELSRRQRHGRPRFGEPMGVQIQLEGTEARLMARSVSFNVGISRTPSNEVFGNNW